MEDYFVVDESERLNYLYRKVRELTDETHRTVAHSMHLLRIEESNKEKILNEIADDKDRYRWKLKDFLVYPTYENLKKIDYFYDDYRVVIYNENGEPLDIEGHPIDLADEPSEEEVEISWVDESEIATDIEMREIDEKEQILEHWQYLERCLNKFIEEPSEDTFMQYMEAKKWVDEREILRKCMEQIANSQELAKKHDFVEDVKKRIEKMDAEILTK